MSDEGYNWSQKSSVEILLLIKTIVSRCSLYYMKLYTLCTMCIEVCPVCRYVAPSNASGVVLGMAC